MGERAATRSRRGIASLLLLVLRANSSMLTRSLLSAGGFARQLWLRLGRSSLGDFGFGWATAWFHGVVVVVATWHLLEHRTHPSQRLRAKAESRRHGAVWW